MKLRTPAKNILAQLEQLLNQLSDEQYSSCHEVFSGASIGQHARHIIEFFECISSCNSDVINYDLRKREQALETSAEVAIGRIGEINLQIDQLSDREITLQGELNSSAHSVKTTLDRELLYSIEHAVHHMAIIKIGLLISGIKITLPEHFGVADSTVKYIKG